VGNGAIAWPQILQAAQKLHMEHYFVGQDKCDKPPIDSLSSRYHYLKPLFANTTWRDKRPCDVSQRRVQSIR